jgi:WD40 repeat protein/serine/threonine protein kinase
MPAESLLFDDELVRRLPLPLAQLYRRAHNAKSALERHQAAFYLWEAALKLLGSVCVVQYAAREERDPQLDECLKNLARPSLGHWWELVRGLLPVLAGCDVRGFTPLRDLLLGDRPRDDLPHAAGLDAALLGERGSRTTVCPKELFDHLVHYRNHEIGHGGLGMAATEDYRRLGTALLAGTAELLCRLDVLAGRRLLYTAEVREVRGVWRVERLELVGEAPRRLVPLELAHEQVAMLPRGERLYLAEDGADGTTGGLVALHPLVVFDEEANECSFLNGRKGKARAEYLCYSSGEWAERPDLRDEQRAILARALGLPAVSAEQAGAWAARSQQDEPADEPSSGPARRTLGEYELLSELGRGGTGVVYRAWQPGLRRQVALKCLAKLGEPEAEARFRREIRALGRVDHPHVAKVFTCGSDGEQWFYVMELVEGVTLSAVCDKLSSAGGSVTEVGRPAWRAALSTAVDEQRKREKPIGDAPAPPAPPAKPPPGDATPPDRQADWSYVDRVVRLVRQAAEGAEALRRRGIVHRDIKPGNIQVDATGERATLMDLGLAQVTDDAAGKLTRTRQFVGTLRYASLEQVTAMAPVDGRSDVYSLGATLWELLALRPIYDAPSKSEFELIRSIQFDEPGPVRPYNPAVRADLEAVLARCLEKDARRRYETAGELAEDLGRHLRGEPVRARPVTALERGWKWVRRRPKEATIFGLLSLLVVLGTIGVVFGRLYRAAEAARSRAEAAEGEAKKARDDLAEQKRRSELAIQGQLDAETQTRKAKEDEAAANKRSEAVARDRIAEFQYVEAIRRAQHFLEIGNSLAGVAELQATDPKRRHWEWSYLAEKLPLVLKGHKDEVRSVSFSPDGRRLASGSSDGTVRVWDLATGGELLVLRGHEKGVQGVSFSPDGRRIASGSEDGTVRVWELAGGGLSHVLRRDEEGVTSVSFSPDGRQLASGSSDGTMRVWDLTGGGAPSLVLKGHDNEVTSVSFSPDGRQLASGSYDRTVRVWDLATGGEPLVLRGHELRVQRVSFSPDGRRLAGGSSDGTVRVWDLTAGGEPLVLKQRELPVWSVSFSPDGRRLAGGSFDGTVRVWDLAGGGEPLVLKGHEKGVWGLAFSPDGRRLASGSKDRTVRVWDLAAGAEPLVLKGHEMPVWAVSFSPDRRRLASGSDDRTVRVWDLATGVESLVLREVIGVSFSPDGRRLAGGSRNGTVRVWDVVAGGEPLVLRGHEEEVRSVAFSPDGRRLASASEDGTVRVWDPVAGGESLVVKRHEMPFSGVAFGPDGRLAGGSFDGTVRVWDVVAGSEPLVLRGHEGPVTSVSFSPDGRQLAGASFDGTVRVWDVVAGGEPLVLRGHEKGVWGVSFSPDGRRLASGSEDGTVRVWDVVAGGEPLVLRGHEGPVTSVSFSPDGRRLAGGSRDGSVRVWETDCRHLWRLREATAAEGMRSWYAARFHLGWLGSEELESARQNAEAACGLISPRSLGAAVTLAALQQREGRTRLDQIRKRHYSACLELDDWAGAEADFAQLRAMEADTIVIWHQRALAMLGRAQQENGFGVACLIPGRGSSPLGLVLGLWPRGQTDTSAFRRVCAEMTERFPAPADAATADYLAWTRLLVADGLTEVDAARLERLAAKAQESMPDSAECLETYGAALYRVGQVLQATGQAPAAVAKFRDAVKQLDVAVKKEGNGGSIGQLCFVAMAHQRLGHVEEARAWVTKAVRLIEAAKNPGWESRLQWQVLRQEAEVTLSWRVPDTPVVPGPEPRP